MDRKLLHNFGLSFARSKLCPINFWIGFFIMGFNQFLVAQCAITAPTTTPVIINSSTLTCHVSPLDVCDGGTLTIGDGITGVKVYMDAELNLTCLGAIQVIVKDESSFDFSPGNNRLYLAEGSSITFELGSDLIGGSCNASERIYIGTNLLASCNGGAGADYTFAELLAFGGTGNLASNSPVCVGSLIYLTATPPPNGSFEYSWVGPGIPANGYSTSSTYSVAATVSGLYQVKMRNLAISSNPMIAQITVVVNTLPTTPSISAGGPTTFCAGGSVTLSSSAGTSYLWSTGATTQSINVSTSGSYTVRVSNANECQSASSSATTVTVNTTSAPTGSASQSFCSGSSPTVSGLIATGISILWYAESSGGSALSSSIPLVDGTSYYASQTVNGCESASRLSVTATINTTPDAPIISSVVQPNCAVPTGSLVITNLPSGTWILSQSGSSEATFSGSGSSISIDSFSPGTYSFTIATAFCVSVSSGTVTFDPLVINTWNGSNWSEGAAPTDGQQNIVFNGSFGSTANLDGCSCTVNSGSVVLNSNHYLKIRNEITVVGGTITFENNSSLVQINNGAVNSGNITYKRKTTPLRDLDFTYWSTPVTPQQLENMSPNTLEDKYFSLNATTNVWVPESPLNFMTPGKGYIVRQPEGITIPTIYEAFFLGVPNNGVISIPIIANAYNLIGNPYPSAIDADVLLSSNSASLTGTLYFWTHNTPPSGSKYSANDYAVYTYLGGTGTGAALNSGVNTSTPTGKIAAGQAFLTVTKSGATNPVVFDNSMRVGAGGVVLDNSLFFKGTKSNLKNSVERHRLWLDLTTEQGIFKQMLVGYITGATNEFDESFDGEILDGNSQADFYSLNQNKKLVIQARALPFEETDVIPLGFRTTVEGVFTIKIDRADGLLANRAVLIEDKSIGKVHDLNESVYSFSSTRGVFNDRFVLHYIDTTAKRDSDSGIISENKNLVLVSAKNKEIGVTSFKEVISKVSIYDLNGKLVCQKVNLNSTEVMINDLIPRLRELIVKVSLKNGNTVSKKIIY